MNGGFGLVLDGSEEADRALRSMLAWDVYNGVARRSWSGNQNARETITRAMQTLDELRVRKSLINPFFFSSQKTK